MEFNKPAPLEFGSSNVAESFKVFKEEIQIYFTATKTVNESREIQVARLKNLLGPEGRRVYATLYNGNDKETVNSILDLLEGHCIPKRNETMEMFKFFSRKQLPNEKFESFLVELKSHIRSCNFGESEEKILKSQIILGINCKTTQQRLLQIENSSLDKVINLCVSVEQTKLNVQEIEGNVMKNTTEVQVNVVQVQCVYCGYKHAKGKCSAYGKKCNACNKMNHFSSVCKSRKSDSRKKVYEAQEKEEEETFQLSLIGVSEVMTSNDKNWYETILLDDTVETSIKIDTGAEANIIPRSVFDMLQAVTQSQLEPTNVRLEMFGGFIIKPDGVINLKMNLNGICIYDKFYVVNKSKCKPILGCQACRKFQLIPDIDCNS
uniref:Peptidase A2 domain-containing protein n=1 Tax=Cacopsylla melanoneura TaxID=428564 RepID=A0A8D8RX22_9HEMI